MRSGLCYLLALLAAILLLTPGRAWSEPRLTLSDIYNDDGYLCIDFRLYEGIDTDLLRDLRDGIPALLRYRVDVWLDRSSWYDKLITSASFSYRINYDNWDTLFCITTFDGDPERRIGTTDVAELIHLVCNQQRMEICPLNILDSLADYYVTVSAEIRSLSADRVREIDSWLGGDEDDKGGGLLGFIVGLFGSRSKTAKTRSHVFNLRGLSR